METPMTPEERFTKIENLMQTVVEAQAELAERQNVLAERQEKQQALVEQDRAAIRDLIVVSRTLIESQRETDVRLKALAEGIKELRETARENEGKIEALIDTVDRVIRRDN